MVGPVAGMVVMAEAKAGMVAAVMTAAVWLR
jgi:hypothetical protein